MILENLTLFKGFIGNKTNELNVKALEYGLIIPLTASDDIVDNAIKMYGKDGSLWNQTFHKSWNKVANAPIMQLILEQIIHYFTTYGFEALGCYNESNIYIPKEELNVPEIEIDKVKFTIINAYTEDEIKEKLMILLTSGIALSTETVNCIYNISDFIDKNRFDEVCNREVRTFLYDKYNIMPKNPEAFLRYLLFKLTKTTLKIQNVNTYKTIKLTLKNIKNQELVLNMLNSYEDYAKLSSIFLRNKNLFLALKSTKNDSVEQKEINHIINKLRKLAVKNHKPLKNNLLDSLTYVQDFKEEELYSELDKVNNFRLVRLLNGLNYRLNGSKDILYRVRNGKSYVATTSIKYPETVQKAFNIIKKTLIERLREKVNNKFIYIPAGITYKAPTSEKQFLGDIPEGSYYELPNDKNLIFAVHWNNLNNSTLNNWEDINRVDLDMHMMDETYQYGWNTSYRNSDRSILFSGDVTSAPAPLGATEAYSLNKNFKGSYLITLNDFNGHNTDVPFEFMIAEGTVVEHERSDNSNYMIDPNSIITKFNMKIHPDMRQITLGNVESKEDVKRLYFRSSAVGVSGAVTRIDEYTTGALNYINSFNDLQLNLNDLLKEAGAYISNYPSLSVVKAKMVTNETTGQVEVIKEEVEVPVDIDLSIENINKTSLIELFM